MAMVIRQSRDTVRMAVLVVVVASAALYLRLIHAGFLSWDDGRNIAANPYYLSGHWPLLWKESYFGLFVPVTSTVWGLLFEAGAGAAWPYRVMNALLHAANTFLVCRLAAAFLERTAAAPRNKARMAAIAGAVLFAMHPLQAGAVAWISGGRDLLAVTFGLIAVLVFFRDWSRRTYAIATLAFVASMLSKPSLAALPIAVVTYAWLFDRARIREIILRMLPWAAFVAAVAWGTAAMQREMSRVSVPYLERPLVALDAAGFYVRKTVWPAGLNVDYGRTPAWISTHPSEALLSIVALAIAAGLCFWRARSQPAFRVALLWPILLLPVLGLVPFAFQRISTVADHYAYPAMIVAAIVFSALVVPFTNRRFAAATVAAFGLLAVAATWTRLDAWTSDEALFTDALAKNPRSFVALINVGRIACEQRQFNRGLEDIGRALALQPAEAPAIADKAYCLYNAGDYDEVVEMRGVVRDPDVQFSLDHNADAASAFANVVAGALFEKKMTAEGWAYLCQALALNPLNENLRANAEDIANSMATSGAPRPSCPPLQPWNALAGVQ